MTMTTIECIGNGCPIGHTEVSAYARENCRIVSGLHCSIEGYAPTRLVSLEGCAGDAGIRGFLVKDESTRFGLKAFKPLGGIYAMFRIVCAELGLDYRLTTLDQILDGTFRDEIAKLTFITTTDGNHGKGVSWASGIFGSRCHVFMPKGTVEARAQAVRDAGNAEVTVTDMAYDDCVRYTAELARRNCWHLIQDTSWPGYETIPGWIMQGYTTMVYEALDQMQTLGYDRPTHVFLQAGVGSMAGTVIGCLRATYGDRMPVVATVEPTEVACFYESMLAGDGKAHSSHGCNETIMAGLNCATPCGLAWDLARDYAAFAIRCSDDVTRHGMRFLDRHGIVSGESGAVTSGLTDLLLTDGRFRDIKETLGLDGDSVILVISTESDTDPENYRKVISDL